MKKLILGLATMSASILAQAQQQEVIALSSEQTVLIRTKTVGSYDGKVLTSVRVDASVSLPQGAEILGLEALLVQEEMRALRDTSRPSTYSDLKFLGCHISISDYGSRAELASPRHVQVLCPFERLPKYHNLSPDENVNVVVRYGIRKPLAPVPPPPAITECITQDTIRGGGQYPGYTKSQCQQTCEKFFITAEPRAKVYDCRFYIDNQETVLLKGREPQVITLPTPVPPKPVPTPKPPVVVPVPTPIELGTYIAFVDNQKFESRTNISRAAAYDDCKYIATKYSKSAVKCTWNNMLILSQSAPVAPVPALPPILKMKVLGK